MGEEKGHTALSPDLWRKRSDVPISDFSASSKPIGGNMAKAYPYILGILIGLLWVVIFKFL